MPLPVCGGGDASRIKLAAGICLVVRRDPIQAAKDLATLDRISNSCFLFGTGGGWNAAEMRDHGTDFTTRFARLAVIRTDSKSRCSAYCPTAICSPARDAGAARAP